MADEFLLDKRQVRRSFARAAKTYDDVAVLQREINKRMSERLIYVKTTPASILDAGSGTGISVPTLTNCYPQADLIELDIAAEMLLQSSKKQSIHGKSIQVCGDIEKLPLADESIDLVWSNLSLQWVNDLPLAFAELQRVLRVGGLLMFTTFGVDTLKELRWCFSQVDDYAHVNRFYDMHDVGDLLLRSQFETPVVDTEQLTLVYQSTDQLFGDLKALGAHNVMRGRNPSLTGKSKMRALSGHYERYRDSSGLSASFEIIYGHAWKGGKNQPPGQAQPIRLYPKTNG